MVPPCAPPPSPQEWEEEDRDATRHDVAALLRHVARRCAAEDRDFWPAFQAAVGGAGSAGVVETDGFGVEREAPLGTPSAAGGASGGAEGPAGDVWQLLGLRPAMPGSDAGAAEAGEELRHASAAAGPTAAHEEPTVAAAAGATAEHAAWAEAEAAQLLRYEQQAAEAAAAPHGAAAVARAAAQAQVTLVVVTLGEAVSHVASELAALGLPWTTLQSPPPGVVHVTLSDVARILAGTPPARAAAARHERLCARLAVAADAVAHSARSVLPWPQVQLCRRSALRWVLAPAWQQAEGVRRCAAGRGVVPGGGRAVRCVLAGGWQVELVPQLVLPGLAEKRSCVPPPSRLPGCTWHAWGAAG